MPELGSSARKPLFRSERNLPPLSRHRDSSNDVYQQDVKNFTSNFAVNKKPRDIQWLSLREKQKAIVNAKASKLQYDRLTCEAEDYVNTRS